MRRIACISALYLLLSLWINVKAGCCFYAFVPGNDAVAYSQVRTSSDCLFLPSSQMPQCAQTGHQHPGQRHAGTAVTGVVRMAASTAVFPEAPVVRLPVLYYVHFLRRLII